MISLTSANALVHQIGVALAVGAATVKVALLLRCRRDRAFVPVYLAVARPVTHVIIAGMIAVTASGLGWILLGYRFTPRLILKVVLVTAAWLIGPLIDNVIEPKFRKAVPVAGGTVPAAYLAAERQYLAVEIAATGLFYAILVLWVLM